MNITATSHPHTGSGSCKRGIEMYAFLSIVYILGSCHYGVALIGISINFLALVKYYSLFIKKIIKQGTSYCYHLYSTVLVELIDWFHIKLAYIMCIWSHQWFTKLWFIIFIGILSWYVWLCVILYFSCTQINTWI